MTVGIVFHFIIAGWITFQFMRQGYGKIHTMAVLMITLTLPIGGPMIVWIVYLLPIRQSGSVADYAADALVNQVASFPPTSRLDIERETDIAPLEDALLLADFNKRRQAILDLLKNEKGENANLINMALHNDDSEVAHYAASSILQSKRKLDVSVHELSRIYEKNPQNPMVAVEYANQLQHYLNQANLDPASALTFRHICIRVLKNIVTNCLDSDSHHMIRLIENLLAVGDFHDVSIFCQQFMSDYPETEEKYLTLLKSYFMIKDKPRFDLAFKRLLDSDIVFSEETMNIVRLWLGAIKHENI